METQRATPLRDQDLVLTADSLTDAARLCRLFLTPVVDRDWSARAGDLEWSCRRTLDHLPDVMLFYAVMLATRATSRLTPPRNGDPDRVVPELLEVLESSAAVLAEVCRSAPPETRAFHPAGMADPEGFVAMAITELFVHTDDIAQGLDLDFRPPEKLIDQLTERLFPWALTAAPWDRFRWATGRIALADHPRQDENWYWHPAPLAEWDGTIARRTRPPGWR